MDFENMMITPVMYQDIPSSFMMQPMMPMYGGMYGGMYPAYGVGTLRPALPNDKFQKLENKNKEGRNAIKKTAIALAILTAAGLFLTKKFPAKSAKLYKACGAKIKSGWNASKNIVSKGWNKLTGVFKKKTP